MEPSTLATDPEQLGVCHPLTTSGDTKANQTSVLEAQEEKEKQGDVPVDPVEIAGRATVDDMASGPTDILVQLAEKEVRARFIQSSTSSMPLAVRSSMSYVSLSSCPSPVLSPSLSPSLPASLPPSLPPSVPPSLPLPPSLRPSLPPFLPPSLPPYPPPPFLPCPPLLPFLSRAHHGFVFGSSAPSWRRRRRSPASTPASRPPGCSRYHQNLPWPAVTGSVPGRANTVIRRGRVRDWP